MMRRAEVVWALVGGLAAAVAPAVARAQTHAVKKPETVVRAVAVYEWTGDEAKPTASRLVPVSLYINAQLEDAGVYMARPVPFALGRGNIFEAQKAGVPEGTLDLEYQQHLEGTSAAPFDDGWLGYASFKPNPNQPVLATKKAGPLPQVVASGGNRPHFSSKTDDSGAAATADPNKPTMQRRTDSDTTATASDSNKPVLEKRTDSTDSSTKTASTASTSSDSDDPNRPVLERRAGSSTPDTPTDQTSTPASSPTASTSPSPATASTSSRGADSTDDADRPTLKKRTPAQQAKNTQRRGDTASVTSGGDLNDDPDRPTLHRGVDAAPSIVPLIGLPPDMHQLVAVSDAKDRAEHDFTRPWESATERNEILEQMQDAARERLAKYDMPAPAAAPEPAKPAVKGKKQAPATPPPPAPATLADESLRGYTLSYGGAATFVYTASSPGALGATRYVTIVAQREPPEGLKVALASVTDSKHLDRTPWMRLVDVVDAEASNRASLLFEMREEHARQFALYRVISAHAEQTFQTGTTE
jgi:hypothetical protein